MRAGDLYVRLRDFAARPGGGPRSPGRSNAVLVLPALIVVFVAAGIGLSSVSGDGTKEMLSKRELRQFIADDQLRNEQAFCTAVAGESSPRCPELPPSRSGTPRFSVTGACLLALDEYEMWFSRTVLEDGWRDFPRWREAAKQVREQCGPVSERTWGNLLVGKLGP